MNKKLKILIIVVISILVLALLALNIKGFLIFGGQKCSCKNNSLAVGGLISEEQCAICAREFTSYGTPDALCKLCATLTNRCQDCGKINK